MDRELSCFRQQRRERVGAEGLKLVDVDEEHHFENIAHDEWHQSLRRLIE